MANFMKIAVNEQRRFRGEEPLTAAEFLRLMREKSAIVELSSKLTSRAVNEGFSGGEKKKNDLPDGNAGPETGHSGRNRLGTGHRRPADRRHGRHEAPHAPERHGWSSRTTSGLLDYIVPDVVHVLYRGRIIYSGDKTLALKLEKGGPAYDWLINDYAE